MPGLGLRVRFNPQTMLTEGWTIMRVNDFSFFVVRLSSDRQFSTSRAITPVSCFQIQVHQFLAHVSRS